MKFSLSVVCSSEGVLKTSLTHAYSWPEPYIYTVYGHIFGDFPAKNTVYKPYIYGSGQPYTCAVCKPYVCQVLAI
jgi:hypothetical protein